MVILNLTFMVFFLPVGILTSSPEENFHTPDTPFDIDSNNLTSRPEKFHIPSLSLLKPLDQTPRGKKFILRVVTITALSVCLISTASAYYYMSEGDIAYDRYLRAGNPDDMNRFFQQSETFDRRAGYSLLIFETSFLISLFSFFLTLEL